MHILNRIARSRRTSNKCKSHNKISTISTKQSQSTRNSLCIYIKWWQNDSLVDNFEWQVFDFIFNQLSHWLCWNVEINNTCMLQILCLTGSPRQPFGAWHRRNCCATPPSHEREHVDHSDHDDHPMFLTRFCWIIIIKIEKMCFCNETHIVIIHLLPLIHFPNHFLSSIHYLLFY